MFQLKWAIRRNQKDHLNIWIKKSMVKFDRKKTTLIEVNYFGSTFYCFFKEPFKELIKDSHKVLSLLNERTDGSRGYISLLENKKGFYFNGDWVDLNGGIQNDINN